MGLVLLSFALFALMLIDFGAFLIALTVLLIVCFIGIGNIFLAVLFLLCLPFLIKFKRWFSNSWVTRGIWEAAKFSPYIAFAIWVAFDHYERFASYPRAISAFVLLLAIPALFITALVVLFGSKYPKTPSSQNVPLDRAAPLPVAQS